MKYYVFSGNLQGVGVDADFPADAVSKAVYIKTMSDDVVLGPEIRVSPRRQGTHALDVHFSPPYEELFPDLFDGEIDVYKVPVEKI